MSLVFVRLFRTFHKACHIFGFGASGSLFSDFQKSVKEFLKCGVFFRLCFSFGACGASGLGFVLVAC